MLSGLLPSVRHAVRICQAASSIPCCTCATQRTAHIHGDGSTLSCTLALVLHPTRARACLARSASQRLRN